MSVPLGEDCGHSAIEEIASKAISATGKGWLSPDGAEKLLDRLKKAEQAFQERDELLRWKAEALVVLNQLNLQKLGEMLNVPIGQSVSEHLLPAVSALLANLKKAQDIIRELDDRESDDESIATLATAHVELLQKNRTELLALVDSLRKLVDSLRNEVRLAWQEGHTSGYRCGVGKSSVDYIDSRARRISENFPP